MNVGELLWILQDYPSDADVCLVDYEIEASVFYQEFNDRHPVGLVEKAGLNVVVLWPHQTCFNCGEVTKYESCECPACALRRRQDNERLAVDVPLANGTSRVAAYWERRNGEWWADREAGDHPACQCHRPMRFGRMRCGVAYGRRKDATAVVMQCLDCGGCWFCRKLLNGTLKISEIPRYYRTS